jgi:hypothetical protein
LATASGATITRKTAFYIDASNSTEAVMTGGPGAFSIQQFCAWAGIGRTLAYKEIESGKLRTKKVGRRTIITVDAAVAWLNALPDGTEKRCVGHRFSEAQSQAISSRYPLP